MRVHGLGRKLFQFACVLMVLSSMACASEFLVDETFEQDDDDFRIDDEAKIADTPEHREMLDVLVQYRQAVVKKDFGTLKELIAPNYYENASTTNTTADDYGHDDMIASFEQVAKHSDQIQYRMVVKRITKKRGQAMIDYEYRYAFQYMVGDETSWDAGVDVNRVTLRKFDGVWKIHSGL